MVNDHIDDLACVAPVETIRTDSHYIVVTKDPVHFLLVVNEIIPILFFQPESVSRQSQTIIAPGQGLIKYFNPPVQYSIRIENTLFYIPIGVGNNFDLPFLQVNINIRNSPSQAVSKLNAILQL
jgi:hypothetical protein